MVLALVPRHTDIDMYVHTGTHKPIMLCERQQTSKVTLLPGSISMKYTEFFNP